MFTFLVLMENNEIIIYHVIIIFIDINEEMFIKVFILLNLKESKKDGDKMSETLGIGKLTRSLQATIPQEVREFLNLNVGDYIAFFKAEDGTVFIRKVKA